jgi:hypothetical protein
MKNGRLRYRLPASPLGIWVPILLAIALAVGTLSPTSAAAQTPCPSPVPASIPPPNLSAPAATLTPSDVCIPASFPGNPIAFFDDYSWRIDSYNGNGLTLAAYLNGILQRNNEASGVTSSPHRNFWETLTYQEKTTGNVPKVSFGPTPPYPILVVDDAANSNFVLALQGIGPLFDNNNGAFGQMPANANPPTMPFLTAEEIQPIIDWINNGCRNPGGS